MTGVYTRGFYLFNLTLALVITCSGCATLEGPENPDDPYERFNRSMYAFNDTIDVYAMKPIAKGYQTITPDAVDKGISSFFSNLDDIIVLINDLLQLKLQQAASDATRIVFNTFFGLLGFIDVSTGVGLPKHNEDFGQTLGYWGVGSGPYIVLPFLGPSSVRDGIGFTVDTAEFDLINNELNGKEKYGVLAVKYIDKRADLLSATNIIDETSPDPYAFIRDAWVQRRLNLVHDGAPPDDEFSDEELFEDDLLMDDPGTNIENK